MVANRSQKKVFKHKSDVVREAVERVLEKKKFYLDTRQSNELHIETEWLEESGYRSRAVVDIKPLRRNQTELKLQLHLEEKLMFRDKWEPMDEIGEDTYKIMLSDIEMECYRVLYDRS
jgi:Arc/MetJ-type ribon-helix-helix transcriptional regulator